MIKTMKTTRQMKVVKGDQLQLVDPEKAEKVDAELVDPVEKKDSKIGAQTYPKLK